MNIALTVLTTRAREGPMPYARSRLRQPPRPPPGVTIAASSGPLACAGLLPRSALGGGDGGHKWGDWHIRGGAATGMRPLREDIRSRGQRPCKRSAAAEALRSSYSMTVRADIMALIWSAILAERFGSTFLATWHSPSFQPRPHAVPSDRPPVHAGSFPSGAVQANFAHHERQARSPRRSVRFA
jgi:hypothetical protein